MKSKMEILRRRDVLKALAAIPLSVAVPVLSDATKETTPAAGHQQVARLELIPPSLVTDRIVLDVRGAVENNSDVSRDYGISLYLDQELPATRVYRKNLRIPPHTSLGVYYRRSTARWAGRHRVILIANGSGGRIRSEREVEVLDSKCRSTRTIGGAWVDLLHWSNAEARYYNAALRELTADDWRQQIRGMHGLGMNTVVVQEVFRNQAYYGRNKIATKGYHGLAFYPSTLFPGRAPIACQDPLGAILSEADRFHMSVFLGVGMYAWFDYSAPSLDWHKKVARELWCRYGRHPSFYGWYVSEEVDGSLIPSQGEKAKDRYRQEIVTFFKEFRSFCRQLAPEKPVMLAPNTFGLRKSKDVWPHVLANLDIVCPFGFGRMPNGDLTGQEAENIWRTMCSNTGTHLWMDMEAFVFQGAALVPRPIARITQTLQRYTNFEEIICYEYSGIFNSQNSRIKPGGSATVALYHDYQEYLHSLNLGAQG